MTAAFAVGAVVGAAGISAVLGVLAGIHYMHGTWLFAATAREAFLAACASGAVTGLMTVLSDWRDWSAAHRCFVTLREMSGIADRLRAGTTMSTDAARGRKFVHDGLGSDDWALQQAALELEDAQDTARPSPPSAEEMARAQRMLDELTTPKKAA